ncbi:MAG: hypothetical protein ACOZF0_20320 [Thermodesulfobacteriota bacterium]
MGKKRAVLSCTNCGKRFRSIKTPTLAVYGHFLCSECYEISGIARPERRKTYFFPVFYHQPGTTAWDIKTDRRQMWTNGAPPL